MSYFPLNYDRLNLIEGTYRPSCVKAYNNYSFNFWERALFQRALSVLKIELPEEWNGSIRDLFNWLLYMGGYVVVFNDSKFGGVVFQYGALSGIDFWYRPTTALISNHAFWRSKRLKIGEQCEILKLTPDYMGISDIITYYAEKLAILDNAINMSLINNKYAFMLGAKNKAAGEALKKMLDKINSGEPAVIYDKQLKNDPTDKSEPWQFWERGNLKESYLTTEQLADFRTIMNNFDSEIGITTLPVEKKERMITDEARSNMIDSVSRSEIWLETFNESAIAVNKMFGTNIKASRRFDLIGEGVTSNE